MSQLTPTEGTPTEKTPADGNRDGRRGGNQGGRQDVIRSGRRGERQDERRGGRRGERQDERRGGRRGERQDERRGGSQGGRRGGDPREAPYSRQPHRNRDNEGGSSNNPAQPLPSTSTNQPPSQSEEEQQPLIGETDDDTNPDQLPEEEQSDPEPASSVGTNSGTLQDSLTTITRVVYRDRSLQPEEQRPLLTAEYVTSLCQLHGINDEAHWGPCVEHIKGMAGLNRQTDEDEQRKSQKKKIDIEAGRIKVETNKLIREHRFCASWAAIIAAILIATATALPVLREFLSQK
jgi:hypothetical protein